MLVDLFKIYSTGHELMVSTVLEVGTYKMCFMRSVAFGENLCSIFLVPDLCSSVVAYNAAYLTIQCKQQHAAKVFVLLQSNEALILKYSMAWSGKLLIDFCVDIVESI